MLTFLLTCHFSLVIGTLLQYIRKLALQKLIELQDRRQKRVLNELGLVSCNNPIAEFVAVS